MSQRIDQEWVGIQQSLVVLRTRLERQYAIRQEAAAEIDEKFFQGEKASTEKNPPTYASSVDPWYDDPSEHTRRIDAMEYPEFYHVVAKLTNCGHRQAARRILELYNNNIENAPRTIDYIETLLIHLEPNEKNKPLPKMQGFTAEELNVVARDYLREHAKGGRVTIRELQKHLKEKNPTGKCSTATISGTKDGKRPGLIAWRAYRDRLERSGLVKEKGKLKAVAFTEKLGAIMGEYDPELLALIKDQEQDDEPSPCDNDKGLKVHYRKRV